MIMHFRFLTKAPVRLMKAFEILVWKIGEAKHLGQAFILALISLQYRSLCHVRRVTGLSIRNSSIRLSIHPYIPQFVPGLSDTQVVGGVEGELEGTFKLFYSCHNCCCCLFLLLLFAAVFCCVSLMA